MQESFELSTAPNVFYQKFFNKFSEIDQLEVDKWKSVHLIAYFCKRYEAFYKVKYSFKFNRSPSKSYEVFQLSRVTGMLHTDNATVVKDYIDWVFDKKLGDAKRRITVIGFLANQGFVNEYKFNNLKAKIITRTSMLPPSYLEIMETHQCPQVTTYGSLAFMKLCVEDEDTDQKIKDAYKAILAAGLDPALLDGLK